ncbi:MAG: hypothetical protein Q8M94_12965, partial [Ignavibacteria bacterium]|nr:hypothetical protein [Ignavibacteria bacterium]
MPITSKCGLMYGIPKDIPLKISKIPKTATPMGMILLIFILNPGLMKPFAKNTANIIGNVP